MYALATLPQTPTPSPVSGGLSLHQLFASLPRDPLSIAVVVFFLISVGMVLHYGRDRSGAAPGKPDA
ncbi:MAG: hypothetical protein R3E10_13655 [Gemmatimonadota bacterium]